MAGVPSAPPPDLHLHPARRIEEVRHRAIRAGERAPLGELPALAGVGA